MKTLLYGLMMVVLCVIPSFAENEPYDVARMNLGITGGGATSVPAFSWEISETFTMADGTTVTGWTEANGDFTILSNALICPTPATKYPYIYDNIALANATRQYGKMKVTYSNQYFSTKFMFRFTTGGDGYVLTFSPADDNIGWGSILEWESIESIQSVAWSVSYSTGWFGFEVYGTGNDTTLSYWYWADDPGDWDAAHTSWGAALGTFTNNPTNARNTGTYVGVSSDNTAGIAVDSFYAGSSGS